MTYRFTIPKSNPFGVDTAKTISGVGSRPADDHLRRMWELAEHRAAKRFPAVKVEVVA